MPRWTRVAAPAAVAASGLAAAGVEAGVFVGDDPTDPAFIHVVAAVPQFALIAAVLLVGVTAWGLLRPLPLPLPLPLVARIAVTVVTVVTAIVRPVVLALILLTAMPLVMLLALAAPVALVTVTVVVARQRRRQAET